MKLLILTSQFPNRDNPVCGVFNLQQALALTNYCEVRVCSPRQWFPIHLYEGMGHVRLPLRDEIQGLPLWHPRYFLTPIVGRDLHGLEMAAWVIPSLARIRREYPFDVLLATWAYPDVVMAAIYAQLCKVPLLAKVHGSDINVFARYPLRRRQIRWALERAHTVLAVSEALGERVAEIGVPREKILVRHNGVDRKLFHPSDAGAARRELGLDPDGRHVVFVGFLTEAKAVHVLIRAAARIRDEHREKMTVHLVGTGTLELELKALTAELGLEGTVLFHGGSSHAQVARWMAAADVFCLPSIREGCPNVILEALASGRPVVASRVGGIPELTSAENAVLVPAGDPAALAAALAAALDRTWDPAALAESVARFSWDETARLLYLAGGKALEAARVPGRAGALADTRSGR